MRKTPISKSGIFNPRLLPAFALCSIGLFLAVLSFAENPPSPAAGRIASGMAPASTGLFSAATSVATDPQFQGVYRGMPVTYAIKNGKAVFQGDIILESAGIDSVSVAYNQYLWPKVGSQYQIPYTIGSGSGNLTNLNTAISQFNSTFSNIQFVARSGQTDYVNFNFDPGDNSAQCEASVGRVGGEQQIGGSGGSFNPCAVGTILHEMGHTIGLWHEQSRADRNTYLSVNYSNLIKGSISNFNQIFDNAQTPTLFDYASIMEYPAFSFSRNGGPAIESIPAGIPLSNLTGYTAADIDGIERLYGNAPTAVTVTSNPPGLHVIVDGATITTPQVFNWALNSTHTLNIPAGVQSQSGNIVNSTTATTFYYTYGRWNDSAAASHSITVLPGDGELTAPATSPAVTTYSANFIQLVPYAAAIFPTGTGSVTPSPAPQSYSGSALVFYTARQQATLTATPNAGQNFYEFNNGPFWLPGGLGANPKTFYVPDTGLTVNTTAEFSPKPVYTINVAPNSFSSNLYVYVDNTFWPVPKNFSANPGVPPTNYDSTWTTGSSHTLRVDNPESPYSFNSRYAFNNWSDGTTTVTDTVILPSTKTTYTANLTPEFLVADYVNETCAGSINVSPASPTGDGFYPTGSVLTFSETPNSGWVFTGWQYDLSGTSSSQPLTVTDETLVTADYNVIATPFTLTSLSPAIVNAGSPGFTLALNGTGFTPSSVVSVKGTFPTVTFVSSTQLKVNVTAAQIAQPGDFQVRVDSFPSGATCSAFAALPFSVANAPAPSYTIAVSASPTAGGTVSGGGTYVSGSSVTVTATAHSGYVFTKWTQSGSTVSTSASYTFTATANRTLVATFTPTYTIAVSAAPAAGGTVSGGGTYVSGSNVTVTATPNSGYTFTNWTQNGAIVSHSASYSFTASANRTLVANFTTNPVTTTTSASPSNGGTTTGDGTYASGASVTVKATATSGYTFTNWTEGGNIVSHLATYIFTLSSNRTFVANFTTSPVTIAASASPSAGGTVSGAGTYASGSSVTLTATAKTGYRFTNWTESGSVVSTSASYSFTATSNRTLVANFIQTYTIAVSASPTAGGTVSGGGTYVSGSSVTVNATAHSGYVFTKWTQSGSTVSTSASYTFTATSNRTLVATFTPTYTISVSAAPSAGGTVSGGGTYVSGSSVTVTATPNGGYTFTNWTQSGAIVSHLASYSFTASANRTLVANFTTNPVTLTTSASPSNGGTTSGDGTYASGANVTAKGTPTTGYTFTYWTDGGSIVSHLATYTFKLSSNRTLVANFTTNPVTITASTSPTAGGTVSGGGTYASGDNVTLIATAKTGYRFTNWTESGSVVSTSASYSFTATSNRTLVANFIQTYTIAASASPTADGTVSGGGTYANGDNVTLTATPKTGHTFTNWTESGSVVSTSASYSFTATSNRTLVANFM
jgi:uncharacterized repeat protein (TIGR02543 family)